MDSERFDQITRALAAGTSRRRVLRGLTGGVLGTLAGALGLRQAEAGPPPKHCKFQDYACRFNTNCCSLNCCNRVCCGEGQACVGGQCVAAACTPTTCTALGLECGTAPNGCDGTLACGTCTGTGESCINGQCVCTAEPLTTTCGTRQCGTATNNCGQTVTCGSCTGIGESCQNGQCVCAPDNVTACGTKECGTATNNCGQQVTCGTCEIGETCNAMTAMCEPSTLVTCQAGADPCVLPVACNATNPNCYCFTSVGGTTVCGTFGRDSCPTEHQCTADADCPGGYCVFTPCACQPPSDFRVCIVPC